MVSSLSLAFVCSLAVSPPSTAPDSETTSTRPELSDDERANVLQLYEDGKVLFNAGQYAAAIEAFEAAYTLSRDDTFLFNIALAQDRLGELDLALDTMQRYRSSLPPEGRGPIDQRIRGLKIRIAAQASAPEPAEDPDGPSDPEATAAVQQAPPCPDPVLPPAPPPEEPQRLFTPAAIVLAASAGTVLVTGGVLGGLSLSARQRASDSCVGGGDTFRCSTSASDDLRTARRTAVAADVALAIGTGLAIGTAVLLINNGSKRRRKQQLRARARGLQLSF